MVNNTSEQTTSIDDVSLEQARKNNNQEQINEALRQKYEREMVLFEEQSNTILDEVRAKGVSVTTTNEKKKLPEMITDIHIMFSRQLPEFVYEGIDTSDELEKELNGTLEQKIKDMENKKKNEDDSEDEDDD